LSSSTGRIEFAEGRAGRCLVHTRGGRREVHDEGHDEDGEGKEGGEEGNGST
jgi:hypothetical protein